jgi:hypothetical protein
MEKTSLKFDSINVVGERMQTRLLSHFFCESYWTAALYRSVSALILCTPIPVEEDRVMEGQEVSWLEDMRE